MAPSGKQTTVEIGELIAKLKLEGKTVIPCLGRHFYCVNRN